MFYHQKVARVRVFADIQKFPLLAWHSLRYPKNNRRIIQDTFLTTSKICGIHGKKKPSAQKKYAWVFCLAQTSLF